ncbi:Transcriptional regulator, AcrR family [hydrothermal vent metagenome]|uniref:Transcriptional regulator, AcrR family n=1 Tax=hydrothermal vent metagenome TaxID=652676 RepID=A0A3B1B4A1_9ZZZZ
MKTSIQKSTPRISAAARKASIIRAAAALFGEKGFSGTKTREIAARAGVSEALIFKHFPSKEDLYAAILAEKSPVPGLVEQIQSLAEQRNDVEVFTTIAETIVGGAPDQNLMRLILFSALESHELSDMFFQNHIRHFYDVLATYIEQRIEDGAFQPVEPLVAARAFMGMLIYHRLLTVLFRAPLTQEPQDIVHTFVTVFMDGLTRKPSQTKKRKSQKTPSKGSKKKRIL